MTMNELVEHIADQIGNSSPDARTRISRLLNVRYKQVTTAIGMAPTRREEITSVAAIGNRLMTFVGTERLDTVMRRVGTKNFILTERTNDEMTQTTPHAEPPTQFSIFTVAPNSVIIKLDCTPTTTFTLYAHVIGDATTLTSNDQPAFPESFHDILIHGVMADEYSRKEKEDKAQKYEQKFENRLSDLRLFIAKSAWLDVYRGKHAPSEGWWDSSPQTK